MSWNEDGSPKDMRPMTDVNAAAFIKAGMKSSIISEAQIKRDAELKQAAAKEEEELFGW